MEYIAQENIKEIDKYWIDVNNNKWTKAKYTKEEAERQSTTLTNCYHCTDCINCYYCINCDDCTYCDDCTDCTDYKYNELAYSVE